MNAPRLWLGSALLVVIAACASSSGATRTAAPSKPTQDPPRVAIDKYDHLKAGCEAGWWETCFGAVVYFASNEIIFNEHRNAVALGELARKLERSPDPSMQDAAMTLAINACRFGADEGCVRLAAETGDAPDATDQAAAIDALKARCDAKHGEACRRLAMVTAIGVPGMPPDVPRAVTLWANGCAAGSSSSCYSEGVSYLNGGGVALDAAKGKALIAKSCAGKYPAACHHMALLNANSTPNVAFSFQEGSTSSVRTSAWKEAHHALGKLCTEGYGPSCFVTSVIRAREMPTADDWNEIADMHQRACNAGYVSSCTELAYIFYRWKPMKDAAAVALAEKGCEAAQAPACRLLGYHYLRPSTTNLEPIDIGKAETSLDKACLFGNADACSMREMTRNCDKVHWDMSDADCRELRSHRL